MRNANFVTEQALDDTFVHLLRVIKLFQDRHGVVGSTAIKTLNSIRKEVLNSVGYKTTLDNAMEPWTTHQEEILLSLQDAKQPTFKIAKLLGRSQASIVAKLDNLKFKSILANYDQIIASLAGEVAEEFDTTSDWFLELADFFWQELATEDLKDKVAKHSSLQKQEVA